MLNNLSIRLPEPLDPGLFIRGSISSEASSQCTKNEMSISDHRYRRKMRKRKAESYAKNPVKCGYLNWGRRYEIIESIGKGLVYLHEDSRLRIVHRDLKASNILLDANLNPKIADFNLAYSFASDKALGFKDKWSASL
nr:putative receptor-like protein kinase At4g00960 [Ipomoea batatas]